MLTHTSPVVDERQYPLEGQESGHVPARHQITTCGLSDPHRAEAEAFVRARFHRAHGANIVTFMPTLLVLQNSAGSIDAVLGCRRAEHDALFLERYLGQSIEESILVRSGARVRRSQIVELGNFAATSPRVARNFMSYLPRYFLERQLTWIAFTATDAIRRILASLGAACPDLGAADGSQVARCPDRWGSYYSHDPRVMAGFLPLARRIPALWKTCHAD